MPEYKKKKVKKHIISSKKPKKTGFEDIKDTEIEMRPKDKSKLKPQKRQKMNVVKGNKLRRMRKVRVFFASTLAIVLVFVLLSVLLKEQLWEIGKRYGIALDTIMKVNDWLEYSPSAGTFLL